ncbi:hypothetical protein [Rhodococcus pyridinivorans]|jgi:hypothetical protein|uniref:hypothetical protein n=1 Tax=Rhodococcus pyridinivorans TaxID=103816 RepID=UPI00110F1573|nr:hypothetical protein [Rhodococcus pyridinivorans]WAL49650.1 hypothetical protein OQN32_26935 [Rhodococcus pyridinivorans]
MKRHVTLAALACIVTTVVSCSSTDDASTSIPSSTAPISGVTTTTPAPPREHQHPYASPDLIRGASAEAAEAATQRFIVGWTTFIPWDFDPAEEWFARWDAVASPQFIGQMQTSINRIWSWTWNEQRKAFDSRVEHVVDTWLSDDSESAVTRVTISRLVLGMNDRIDQIETQTLTYDVALTLSKSGFPQVVAVTETSVDAPPPTAGAPR